MADTAETQVLIAGAGPIGLTAAIELARRGIDCRIVDPLLEPPQYAKAVGVQPRTLEVFEGMGVLRRILDAAIQMRGQIVYLNGVKTAQLDMTLPADVPFGFLAIPQYATERILREKLATRGVRVERGLRLTGFEQDPDGVSANLTGDDGEQTVRARYLVGADGAHSAVRKGLGLTFEGPHGRVSDRRARRRRGGHSSPAGARQPRRVRPGLLRVRIVGVHRATRRLPGLCGGRYRRDRVADAPPHDFRISGSATTAPVLR